jgi:hypothetical protein
MALNPTLTPEEREAADTRIVAAYDRYDVAFRAAKKRGDYRTASVNKVLRDDLAPAMEAIMRRRAGKGA